MKPKQQLHLELKISNQNHPITLDYRRAVYLQETKTLLVSDLHWGKSQVFQKHGIPVTEEVLQEDLRRLSDLLAHYTPNRLLILGDLIHGVSGLTDSLMAAILQWRQENPVPVILVEGNHDRSIKKVATQWEIELSDDFQEGPFFFSHYPQEKQNLFNWCGHIHPKVLLTSPSDTIRLPCFHLTKQQGTLPAFSLFTGGQNIEPQPTDQVIVVGEDFLMSVNL